MKSLLAMDIGTHCGLVWESEPKEYKFIHWDFSVLNITRHEKLCAFYWQFPKFLKEHSFDSIMYERPFSRGLAATRMGWGFGGLIDAIGTAHGCAVGDIGPKVIKKWATGNGNASKEDMIVAANEFLGFADAAEYVITNEHLADAMCLYQYSKENIVYGE